MSKIGEIFEGWRNRLIPPKELKVTIDEVSKERLTICSTCPWNSKNRGSDYRTMRPDEHCTQCGCTLSAKVACLSCSCPIDKWKGVITPEEEVELNKQNSDEKNV